MLISDKEFDKLPLLVEGHSKEIRHAGDGVCFIKFLPTIYSYTANRAGVVKGSERLRLEASRIFVDLLQREGIDHAYKEVGEKYVKAHYLRPRQLHVQEKSGIVRKANFDEHERVPDTHGYAPNIETIWKRYHSGTTKHKYLGMNESPIRQSHKYYGGFEFDDMDAYPNPIIRFDWRNPLTDPETGQRLRDEAMCEDQASWYINTDAARQTALRTGLVLEEFLNENEIVLYDMCLFISEDGSTVYGEISQDCGRFRHFDIGSLDKDVWRSGGSSQDVLDKWELLLKMIS